MDRDDFDPCEECSENPLECGGDPAECFADHTEEIREARMEALE